MNKCVCGGELHVDAGDGIPNGTYRWYASYHCDRCGKSIEIDGCDIDSIPDEIKLIIIRQRGEWGLESSAGKVKIKYLMNKILKDKDIDFLNGIFFRGTEGQVKWVIKKLIERGMTENELVLKKI